MATSSKIFEFVKLNPQNNPDIGPEEDEHPEPRSGHRVVVFNGNLYSIGGYNPRFWDVDNNEDTYYPLFKELWKFNLATRKWKKLQTHGEMPVELASHSACLYGQCLLVFGGTGVPFGDTASNDLHSCNLKTLQWRRVECKGPRPIRSYGHAITTVDNILYVHGGTTGWEYNSELHWLNLSNSEWEDVCIDNDQVPLGRYRHEIGHYGNKLFVLGGGRSYESYSFECIPVFNIETKKWLVQQCSPDSPQGFPVARRCHSCVQLNNDVFISGGYNGEEIFGDIWRLNLKTLQWTRLPRDMPEPSYFHSAALQSNGRMITFGGVVEIDIVRTSDVHAMWLKIPTLKELVWDLITQRVPHLDKIAPLKLFEAGIPLDLIERLS